MGISKIGNIQLDDLIFRRKKLRRELFANAGLKDIRIAVLGGSTTNELVDFLEIFLLQSGFRPAFQQSEYGRFYEDAVLEPELIAAFQPDIVYLHTSSVNIKYRPPISSNEAEFSSSVDAEISRFRAIWASLGNAVGCQIIQNNFELPPSSVLGNLDAISPGGSARFIHELNRQFAAEAGANARLIIQDINGISARVGLNRWLDPERWFSYKIANSVEGTYAIAASLAAQVRAMYGRSCKLLVLDLDNTLWGG